jgi:RNAse (barnase) inhibitor barstar
LYRCNNLKVIVRETRTGGQAPNRDRVWRKKYQGNWYFYFIKFLIQLRKIVNKTIVINGSKISSLDTFYDEVESKLTKDLDWKIGKNLDAFNDVLRGGFGVYEYEEPIKLIWTRSNESKRKLGWDETVKYISAKLKTCHPTNIQFVKDDLDLAQQHKEQTLFELIVDIIRTHQYIELDLN